MPRILTGRLHPSNVNCIDWSSRGLIAYGAHNLLVIVDAFTLQVVQTLDVHNAAVNHLRWRPANSLVEHGSSTHKRLASADISGEIIVTDVVAGTTTAKFAISNSAVLALRWFGWKDDSRDFILALHSHNTLVLWNAESGEKMWSHQYSHKLFDLAIDPFSPRQIAFTSNGGNVVLSRDIALTEPISNGSVINLSNNASSSEAANTTSIQHLRYHNAYRNTLYVLLNGSLFAVETELCAILFVASVEQSCFTLLSCTARDAIFTVAANGTISLRVGIYTSNDDRADAQLGFNKVTSSEVLRHGAQERVVGATLCPSTQSHIAILYSSGRILFWQLCGDEKMQSYRKTCISDFLTFNADLSTTPSQTISLQQIGHIGAISNAVSALRMRPMDEVGQECAGDSSPSGLEAAHIAALGTQAGVVQLVDVLNGTLLRELSVQSSPIKMLEWGGANIVLTAGYNHALSTSQLVRNDIYATNIQTGTSRRIRPETDESPVTLLRVSFYHCYLALAFQREPLEIWDIKNFRLLRKMSKTCPLITDMAWSSKHHGVKTTESSGQTVYRENLVVLDSDNRLYHIIVRGLHVKDGKEVNTQWKSGGWTIRSMAWKNDTLAMGDADGRIAIWDLAQRRSRHVRASRMPVVRMCFSRLAGDHTLAVLNQRELSLWDTEALSRLQVIALDSLNAIVDMDLCGVSPIYVTNDNVFHHSTTASGQRNFAISEKELPPLVNDDYVEKLALDFQNGTSDNILAQELLEKTVANGENAREGDDDEVDLQPLLRERALRELLGDSYATQLIDIVLSQMCSGETIVLPPNLQMFWPNERFREREMRVACAACKSSAVLESKLVEQCVVVGGKAKDLVIDRLIASPDLRHASIKAALLVSSQENEQAKSLIKLIATNLIASDLIEDGVEMLFLVSAGADACKYLQSQNQWEKSVVYAKIGLPDPEDVISKWISHLAIDQKSRHLFALASRGDWPAVVENLSLIGRSSLARLVLRASTSTPPATSRATPAATVA